MAAAGGLLALGAGPGERGGDPVALHELVQVGATSRVVIELKAEGKLLPPPPPPGAPAQVKAPRPLAMRLDSRFAFDERVLKADREGMPTRVLRRVVQAAAAINGDVKPTAPALRPEVALLVAELRQGAVFTASAGGPLTQSELEVTSQPGDPLALPDLLPAKPVAVGDHWPVGPVIARSLSGYEALAANGLEATLESASDATARVKLAGVVRGAIQGGEGSVTCSGWFTFDRVAGRINHLSLTRTESRKPGQVELGLDVKSTLTIERTPTGTPPELADTVVASLPAALPGELEEVLYLAPEGKYALRYGRDWHIFTDDTQQLVLKLLDHGELVAQCNLVVGPNAGKGRHQDLKQFKDDIRRALGRRFGEILEAGEVEGPADGSFRYRVAVAGHEGDVGVLWYYYLVASADGDQLLATFTLGQAQAKQFADQDLRLIGSLEWKPQAASATDPPTPKAR